MSTWQIWSTLQQVIAINHRRISGVSGRGDPVRHTGRWNPITDQLLCCHVTCYTSDVSQALVTPFLCWINPGANGETVWSRKSDSLPTTASLFRHFLQRKDVVNQCLEFGIVLICQTQSAAHVRQAHKPPNHSLPPLLKEARVQLWTQGTTLTEKLWVYKDLLLTATQDCL